MRAAVVGAVAAAGSLRGTLFRAWAEVLASVFKAQMDWASLPPLAVCTPGRGALGFF